MFNQIETAETRNGYSFWLPYSFADVFKHSSDLIMCVFMLGVQLVACR